MAISVSPYVANRFALELDGRQNAGFVSAIDGGQFKATAVKSMVGNTNYVTVYSGKPTYDDITITVGMAMSPAFWKWIKASLDNKPERRNGALVGYDFNGKERSRRTFYGALISQVKFPALDASKKSAASLSVTITPERLEYKKGDESTLKADTGQNEMAKQKRWLTSNFRFELDRFKGDESLRSLTVDGFTVKQNVTNNPIGYELETRKAIGRLEMPQVTVTFPEHNGAEWMKWYEKAIVKGNRKEQTTTGVLTYFSPDHKELMRLEMAGVSLLSLEIEKFQAPQDKIANITATLNLEALKLVPGEGNV